MSRFTLPRDIYHGPGSLSEIAKLKGKKAFVVTGGGSMKRFGFLGKTLEFLREAGMETHVFEGVEPDPSVETVRRGAEEMKIFCPDWIVAIGGGSPIDAAKAMWAFYEHPDISFESLCTPFSFPELRQKAHFCAIPSTSGSATEVTAFSVITDYEKGIKYPLADFNITPDVAVVDPDIAQTMPPKLAAHTGMDAFTHAVEAYVSTLHSEFTDPLALRAISLVSEYLIDSFGKDALCAVSRRNGVFKRAARNNSFHGAQDRSRLLRRTHRPRMRERDVSAEGNPLQLQNPRSKEAVCGYRAQPRTRRKP